jgi:ATP-dependent Lhr-like helicase
MSTANLLLSQLREYTKDEVLKRLNPLVAKWFGSRFRELTPPQKYAIIPIKEGRNVLVSSPTGSGKTLAAFLSIISELFDMAVEGRLENSIYAVYISPLRALDNDIYRNLMLPLQEIRKMGDGIPEIRHAVRTGDTTQSERQSQLRKPPHILITTPETFSIVITAPKFREKLRTVKWVIVDEIHSIVENKRGSHLGLSLERFSNFLGRDPVRIGLSATINPLDRVAQFLVGYENGKPRECLIIDVSFLKKKDVALLAPSEDMVNTPVQKQSDELYNVISRLVQRRRSTLIFTNTRSGAERVTFHLKQKFRDVEEIDELIAAHHSSLSREVRMKVEDLMKKGKLKAIVSSTSLELGIDVGYIDLVVQVGSPKSVTRAVQRTGRSGHGYEGVIKGRFIAMDRDDAVELAVMAQKAMEGFLDEVHIPEKPLDVLAQHIVGMALEKKWSVDEALSLIRRAYPFRNLEKEEFISVLKYLSGSYGELEGKKVYGKIWFDGEYFGRRGRALRAIYSTNIGTIPEQTGIKVYTEQGRFVGKIEEEFFERLSPGDRFVLAGKVFEYVKSRSDRLIVRHAKDQKPTVPSWYSEMLPLSFDLAVEIGKFRRYAAVLLEKGEDDVLLEYLREKCRADERASKAIYNYIKLELEYLRSLGISADKIPSDKVIQGEIFLDEDGRYRQIYLSLFGRRANDALSRALGYIASRRLERPVGITVTDNGFSLSYPIGEKPVASFKDLLDVDLEEVLKKALEATDLMRSRFRHVAIRGLMILRNYKGYEISVSKQRMNADSLIKIVKRLNNFPLLRETYREIMEDYMDIKRAKIVIDKVRRGEIEIVELGPLEVPTPFAQLIAVESLSDVIFMEDRMKVLRDFERRIKEMLHAGA